jgi:hypothetical protein
MFTGVNTGRSTATPVGMTCHHFTRCDSSVALRIMAARMPDGSRTRSNRAGHRVSCIRFRFDAGSQTGHAKPSGLGMVSTLSTRRRAPRKPPDRRTRALMWNMRRRHSSHSWLTPAAEASVKVARFVRAALAVGAKRRAFTDDEAEGTRPQPAGSICNRAKQ